MPKLILPPEVLENVFRHLSKSSNAKNMRVCKQWLNIVEPVFWRDVADYEQLGALLSLLGTWEVGYDQARISTKADWRRFLKVSCMIRSLKVFLHSHSESGSNFTKKLSFLAITRPTFDLTPNLQKLVFYSNRPSSWALSNVFAHARLKTLIVEFDSPQASSLTSSDHPFLRTPHLDYFELRTVQWISNIPNSLLGLGSLLNLKSVTLPRFSATRAVIAALSRLPLLRKIGSNDSVKQFNNPPTPAQAQGAAFNIFDRGAFPSLKEMTLAGTVTGIQSILRQPHFPQHITSLALEIWKAVGEEGELHECIAAVHMVCRAMTSFTICDGRTFETPTAPTIKHRELMEASHWRLTKLDLACDDPIFISDRDIETFSRAIPSIEDLALNAYPRVVSGNLPSASILRIFARNCTRLKKLGVLFDTSTVQDILDDVDVVPFSALEVLDVGTSTLEIQDVQAVSTLLVQLLPIVPPYASNAQFLYEGDAWAACDSTLRIVIQALKYRPIAPRA